MLIKEQIIIMILNISIEYSLLLGYIRIYITVIVKIVVKTLLYTMHKYNNSSENKGL